jgi:hypothetical protein
MLMRWKMQIFIGPIDPYEVIDNFHAPQSFSYVSDYDYTNLIEKIR